MFDAYDLTALRRSPRARRLLVRHLRRLCREARAREADAASADERLAFRALGDALEQGIALIERVHAALAPGEMLLSLGGNAPGCPPVLIVAPDGWALTPSQVAQIEDEACRLGLTDAVRVAPTPDGFAFAGHASAHRW